MSEIQPGSRIPRRRRLVFGLVTIIISGGFSLACVELFLRFQRHRIEHSDRLDEGMIVYDRYLGWRLQADSVAAHHHHDFDVRYTINRHGFRGQFADSDGETRYAVVGDSFTFGIGVDDAQTFVSLLNEDPTVPGTFLNFSVPAFSTDQQYLLIRDRVGRYKPDVLLLVVYLANDLLDNELDFPLQAGNAKPYFELNDNGRLQRRNLPVPRTRKPPTAQARSLASIVIGADAHTSQLNKLELIRRTGWIQDHGEFSDEFFEPRLASAMHLFTALVDAIVEVAEQDQMEMKLVLMPGSSYLASSQSVSKQYQDYLRRRIVDRYAGHPKIELIDLARQLRDRHQSDGGVWYFPHEGHLTPAGHHVVADLLANRLRTMHEEPRQ